MPRCYLPLPSGDREEAASEAGSDRANETLENSTDAPLVNGTAGSKDGSVADKVRSYQLNYHSRYNIYNLFPVRGHSIEWR